MISTKCIIFQIFSTLFSISLLPLAIKLSRRWLVPQPVGHAVLPRSRQFSGKNQVFVWFRLFHGSLVQKNPGLMENSHANTFHRCREQFCKVVKVFFYKKMGIFLCCLVYEGINKGWFIKDLRIIIVVLRY